jgi:hypothetical protein
VAAAGIPLFAGAAAATWFIGYDKFATIKSQCDMRCSQSVIQHKSAAAHLKTYETATDVFLGTAGAAVLTTGLIFYLETRADDEQPPASGAALTPTGIVAWGRF